jgi:hypothetical protein
MECKAGSLTAVAREGATYKSDLMGVQYVRWDWAGTEPTGRCIIFYENGSENHE